MRECTNCKHACGLGSNIWCEKIDIECEPYMREIKWWMRETRCPYWEEIRW